MSFDQKCLDLAEHFLPSQASDRLKRGLAQAIQNAVEDYGVGEIENLKVSLTAAPSTEVYSQPDCTFRYCPHPDVCKAPPGSCICKHNVG